MRLFDPARAFLLGWHLATKVPEAVTRGVMHVGADVAWLMRTKGVCQLEANIRRARPEASRRELRRLSREGMRNYLRYFAEAFNLPRLTPEQIDARVRPVGVSTAMADAWAWRPPRATCKTAAVTTLSSNSAGASPRPNACRPRTTTSAWPATATGHAWTAIGQRA